MRLVAVRVDRKLLRFAALPLLACALSCAGAPQRHEPAAPAAGLRVLFLGNSLTAANDLPGTVQALARADGRAMTCASVVRPNVGLEDHWNEGEALRRIAAGGWDVVVLQQGPSSLPANQENLRRWSERFAAEIRAAGARPALLMVWPSRRRAFAFDAVSEAYTRAAASVDGLLLPAGDAWRAAWRRDPSLPLYGPDGFHPSPMGTYLAALVIHERLFGEPVSSATSIAAAAGRPGVTLTAGQAALLADAAHEAVGGIPDR